MIRSRLPVHDWPDRDLRITAVDTESGEFTVFTRDSGVDLVSAVAASCAVPTVWPPVEIAGRTYMDGGMRSTANVDVATGAERVVVLAPLPRSVSKKTSIQAQMEQVAPRAWSVVTPDAEALAAFGRNLLDPAKRAGRGRGGPAPVPRPGRPGRRGLGGLSRPGRTRPAGTPAGLRRTSTGAVTPRDEVAALLDEAELVERVAGGRGAGEAVVAGVADEQRGEGGQDDEGEEWWSWQ